MIDKTSQAVWPMLLPCGSRALHMYSCDWLPKVTELW